MFIIIVLVLLMLLDAFVDVVVVQSIDVGSDDHVMVMMVYSEVEWQWFVI